MEVSASSKWRKEHPEEFRELKRKWKKNNPDTYAAQKRRWRKRRMEKDPEGFREYNRIKQREYRAKLKERASLVASSQE